MFEISLLKYQKIFFFRILNFRISLRLCVNFVEFYQEVYLKKLAPCFLNENLDFHSTIELYSNFLGHKATSLD